MVGHKRRARAALRLMMIRVLIRVIRG
jgi:hypothetical protein